VVVAEIQVHPGQAAQDSQVVAYLVVVSKQVFMEQAALDIKVQAIMGLAIKIPAKAIINRIIIQVIRVTPRS
jgi:hypothetical protein